MAELILPPLRRSVADAIKFARTVHGDQRDKAGKPYIEHLRRVAEKVVELSVDCPFWDDNDLIEACHIAWLHDTIEDTSVAGLDLEREGFSNAVLHSVLTLSNLGKKPYASFIATVIDYGSLATILVKLADVEDNSDPERLAVLDEATRERLTKKYAGAADLLRKAAREKGWQG